MTLHIVSRAKVLYVDDIKYLPNISKCHCYQLLAISWPKIWNSCDHLPYFKKDHSHFFHYKWLFIFQINCAVKDKGFPKSDTVRWLHNGHEIKGRTTFGLTFNHADVFSSGNYSCVPFNQVGMAQPGKTSIRIFSPPNFVQSLPPVSGK